MYNPEYFTDLLKSRKNTSENQKLGSSRFDSIKNNDGEQDVEEIIFSDQNVSAKSLMSKPLHSFDLKEVRNLSVEFVYNYFTKSERSFDQSRNEFEIIDLQDADISEKHRQKRIPRFVKFSFKRPKGVEISSLTNAEKSLMTEENIQKILFEGESYKNIFMPTSIVDSGNEKTIFELLNNSSVLINDQPIGDKSYEDAANELSEILNASDGVTGIGKKLLLESMCSQRSKGFSIAKNDVIDSLAVSSKDPISNIEFNCNLNKIFAKNIINQVNKIPTGIFFDELKPLEPIANEIYDQTISEVIDHDQNKISENEMSLFASPIDITNRELNDNSLDGTKTETKLIGYYIEKIEVFNNESIVRHNPIFILSSEKSEFVDENIRYSGKYVYKVRSVFMVKSQAIQLHPSKPYLDKVVVAKYLIGSSGITASIVCTENIPPLPPSGVSARMNYETKKPIIYWQFPLNKQRDIKRFQIFKRSNENLPFTLLAEYDFDDSVEKASVKEIALEKNIFTYNKPKTMCIDESFLISEEPIYAIASVDAHGLSSNLSAQIKVKYNKYENRLMVKLLSRSGAPKQYPNMFIEKDTFLDNIKTSGYDRMHIFFNPEYYRVFKNIPNQNQQGTIVQNDDSALEKDVQFINTDRIQPAYVFQMLNVDSAKDKKIKIFISDDSNSNIVINSNEINQYT